MKTEINCPACDHINDANTRHCRSCGANILLSVILAEREVSLQVNLSEKAPVTPEILVPRLGEYLVENGELQPIDLERALSYQNELAYQGRSLLLGQALLELELIDRETLDKAITEQILHLQAALHQANQDLEERVRQRTLELERAFERLQELNQLKANFIANISHELRTPLTHIKGYLELLMDGELGTLSSSQYDALSVMLRSEARLERLIEDLIQYSLAEKGEFAVNLHDVQIAGLIEAVEHDIIPPAKARDITVQVRVADCLPPVLCDEEKISWVIRQLLDNAIKFSPQGSQVGFDVYRRNGSIYFEVTDTGIGIPRERLAEIFEPFHQLDGSATRRFGGTGLGLALSKRIISAHGTDLFVRSELGVGSVFGFTLPIYQPQVEELTSDV